MRKENEKLRTTNGLVVREVTAWEIFKANVPEEKRIGHHLKKKKKGVMLRVKEKGKRLFWLGK